MTSRNRFQDVSRAACLVSAIALVACGGASDDQPSLSRDPLLVLSPPLVQTTAPTPPPSSAPTTAPTTLPASQPIPGVVTLEQFLASKPPPPSAAAVLGATQRQQLMELSAQRTVDLLRRALSSPTFTSTTSAGAVPALIAGHVDLLRQAAAGDTLAQINSQWPELADAGVAAALRSPLSRSIWVQTGFEPLASFLAGTDNPATALPLRGWSARNADMANGAYLQSASTFGIPAPADTRLEVLDTLDDATAWPEAVPFEGVFVGSDGVRRMATLIRFSSGVGFYRGSTFRADLLRQGGRTLFQIRPDPEDTVLLDYVRSGQLLRALRELGEAFAPGATPLVHRGEMVLPPQRWSLDPQVMPATFLALPLAYNELNANFKRLDGLGGTYAIASESLPVLNITAAGVSMQAANATALRFSTRNVNGPGGYGAAAELFNGGYSYIHTISVCPHAGAADLSSFILAQLDERGGWVWTLAVPTLGDPCMTLITSLPG